MVNKSDQIGAQFKQDVVGVYNRAAPTYDRVGIRFFSYFGSLLVEQLNIHPDACVLDVATGRGAVLFPAAEKVAEAGEVIGIDLAPVMLEYVLDEIKELGLTNVRLALMDGDHVGFAAETFDYILCGSALFLLNYEYAVNNFYRLLKPGGYFAAWVPTNTQDSHHTERWKWLSELTVSLFPPGFTPPITWVASRRLNTPDLLERSLLNAGFVDISISREETDMTFIDEHDWWAWEWSQAPRFTLEALAPSTLEQFKSAAFSGLQALKEADGIHFTVSALFATGRKVNS